MRVAALHKACIDSCSVEVMNPLLGVSHLPKTGSVSWALKAVNHSSSRHGFGRRRLDASPAGELRAVGSLLFDNLVAVRVASQRPATGRRKPSCSPIVDSA